MALLDIGIVNDYFPKNIQIKRPSYEFRAVQLPKDIQFTIIEDQKQEN